MIELLSQGQKIKALRNRYGLKQSDIGTESCTREFISMVENEKRSLGRLSSIELIKKINSLEVVEKELPEDYLCLSKSDELLKQYTCNKYSSKLSDFIDKSMEINDQKLTAFFYKELAFRHFNSSQFDLAKYYITNSLLLYAKSNDTENLSKTIL